MLSKDKFTVTNLGNLTAIDITILYAQNEVNMTYTVNVPSNEISVPHFFPKSICF